MNRAEIERALQAGEIGVRMNNGSVWTLRRNGRTKLWATRPNWFRIPVKAGLRVYDEITHESTIVHRADDKPGFVLV